MDSHFTSKSSPPDFSPDDVSYQEKSPEISPDLSELATSIEESRERILQELLKRLKSSRHVFVSSFVRSVNLSQIYLPLERTVRLAFAASVAVGRTKDALLSKSAIDECIRRFSYLVSNELSSVSAEKIAISSQPLSFGNYTFQIPCNIHLLNGWHDVFDVIKLITYFEEILHIIEISMKLRHVGFTRNPLDKKSLLTEVRIMKSEEINPASFYQAPSFKNLISEWRFELPASPTVIIKSVKSLSKSNSLPVLHRKFKLLISQLRPLADGILAQQIRDNVPR